MSPDHTWENSTILMFFRTRSSKDGEWFRELYQAGKIARIDPVRFNEATRFYAIPPEGFVPTRNPEPLTVENWVYRDPIKSSHSVAADRVNWGKWGAIASIVAVPVAVAIWWFS